MKHFLLVSLAATTLLSACSDEPEVVVVEPIDGEDVNYAAEDEEEQAAIWDADGDGLLNRQEYVAFGDSFWFRWDADSDGAVTQDEFGGAWTQAGFSNAEESFTRLDSDADGVLSRDEFFTAGTWQNWDVDGSGMLEQAEFPYYAN